MLAILGASSEKIMTDLLLDCSLFLPVETGDGNYVQLTGKPLFSAVPITDVKVPPSQATKAGTKPKPLSDITFSRSRMFYKKASLTKSAGKVHFGMTRKRKYSCFILLHTSLILTNTRCVQQTPISSRGTMQTS